MTEDPELARRMRAGLESRAGEADTTAPVVSRARAAASRRRGARLTGLVAAAVAAVAVTGFVVDRAGSPGGIDRPGAVDEPSGEVADGPWRTEYWRDMRVDVPADWGYGGAPQEGTPETVACGAVAMVSATGERLPREDPTMPYVGRPIAQTDLCQVYPWIGPNDVPPQAPYVWLGAAVEPGTVDLGDGWVQETVDVNGSRLTVATRDAGLRERILDSAGGGETCMSEVDTRGATFPRVPAGTPKTPRRSRSAPIAPTRVPPRVPRQDSSTPRVPTGRPSVTTSTRSVPPALRRTSARTPTSSRPSGSSSSWATPTARSSGATSCTWCARASTWTERRSTASGSSS